MKTTLRESQVWREILSAHSTLQTTPPRLVVDAEFLSRWEAGDLSEQEHQALLDELATSQESRQIITLLMNSGSLTLPASDRDDMPAVLKESERPTVLSASEETRVSDFSNPPVFASAGKDTLSTSRQGARSRHAMMTWLPVGLIAAGVAVAVTLSIMNPGGNGPLTAAMTAMQNNDLQEAFEQADEALAVADTANEREAAFEILTQSGEQLADTALAEGRFEDVRLVSDRVSEHSELSESADAATRDLLGRIESLRLQARRGLSSALALTQLDSLGDYGINSDGPLGQLAPDWLQGNPEEGMTETEIAEIREDYEQAIAEFPSSPQLRLNFGQFLLEQRLTEEALEQFRAILDGNAYLLPDPENRDALVGMAIALFNDPEQESAAEAMRKLLEMLPDDAAAADILNSIQGNLGSRIPEGLLPDGLVPSTDTLDMLQDSLQNFRQQEEERPAQESAEPEM